MTAELLALEVNHTLELIQMGVWIKVKLDGSRYKQEYNIDHEQTFAPVAKMTSATLLAVAVVRQWPLC